MHAHLALAGGAQERAASGKTVQELVKEGAAAAELRSCGVGRIFFIFLSDLPVPRAPVKKYIYKVKRFAPVVEVR